MKKKQIILIIIPIIIIIAIFAIIIILKNTSKVKHIKSTPKQDESIVTFKREENNKIITNSNIYLTQNQTFENARQCLKWVKNLPWNYLDFWEDLKSCNFSNSEKITKIDWVEYSIFIENKTDFWNIKIDSWNLKAETKIFPK